MEQIIPIHGKNPLTLASGEPDGKPETFNIQSQNPVKRPKFSKGGEKSFKICAKLDRIAWHRVRLVLTEMGRTGVDRTGLS